VLWIQPGIESLHDSLLKQINKGNSAIGNIALLKYLQENGIRASWNMLIEIPNHKEKWYLEMANLIPLLHHLQPPSFTPIRFDRFSVYHKNPDRFGIELSPAEGYSYIYPIPFEALDDFAYFFDDKKRMDRVLPVKDALKVLHQELVCWCKLFMREEGPPVLIVDEDKNRSIITDTRSCTDFTKLTLSGLEHIIYKICRHPVKRNIIIKSLKNDYNLTVSDKELYKILKFLQDQKILIQIKDKYLSLANYRPKRPLLSNDDFPGKVRTFTIRARELHKKIEDVWNWFENLDQ
jgi:magnesium-protoporphyrin IX monomethyl ester (oxidative) cyclase